MTERASVDGTGDPIAWQLGQFREFEIKVKVFIADSSDMICQRLAHKLSELEGVEIIGCARDPNTALGEIGRLRPHVVLLDVHLFRGNGLEILRKVKHEKWALFVLMLTGDASVKYHEKCAKAGADYILYKPNAPEKAKEILSGLLDLLNSSGG